MMLFLVVVLAVALAFPEGLYLPECALSVAALDCRAVSDGLGRVSKLLGYLARPSGCNVQRARLSDKDVLGRGAGRSQCVGRNLVHALGGSYLPNEVFERGNDVLRFHVCGAFSGLVGVGRFPSLFIVQRYCFLAYLPNIVR